MGLRKARHHSPRSSPVSPELRHEGSAIAPDTGLVNRNRGANHDDINPEHQLRRWAERGICLAGGETWWSQHREATLNWLALGLLLAAWNASDDPAQRRLRPEPLRRYSAVSVRAAAHHRAEISAPSSR